MEPPLLNEHVWWSFAGALAPDAPGFSPGLKQNHYKKAIVIFAPTAAGIDGAIEENGFHDINFAQRFPILLR